MGLITKTYLLKNQDLAGLTVVKNTLHELFVPYRSIKSWHESMHLAQKWAKCLCVMLNSQIFFCTSQLII